MFCHKCGTELPENSEFTLSVLCPKCKSKEIIKGVLS